VTDGYEVQRRKLLDDERKARSTYDAAVLMTPLPAEGITAHQLDRLVDRSKRELELAEAAIAEFKAAHPD